MKKIRLTAALLALALLLAACQASQPPYTEPTETQAPTETQQPTTEPPTTAAPETEPALSEGETTETTLPEPNMTPLFLRIRDGSPGIIEKLRNGYTDNPDLDNDIPSYLFRDAEGLEEFHNLVNATALYENGYYDSDFFAQCDLLVIPRTTTSGSVQHSVEIEYGDITTVTVTAELPEMGTSDMCDWLLLVPLAKSDAPAAAVMEGGWNPTPGNLVTE